MEDQKNRDDIATLVRLAGKRRNVPAERTERVREAARAQWQREIRLQSRKRWIAPDRTATEAVNSSWTRRTVTKTPGRHSPSGLFIATWAVAVRVSVPRRGPK